MMTAGVTKSRYLSAESIRVRNSTLQWLPLVALPLMLATYALASAVPSSDDATAVLMWQALYLTGLAAPLAALFGAAAESREKKARFGATLWLPVNMVRQRTARFIVVVLSLGAFHLLNFGGTAALMALAGNSGSGQVLLVGLFAFVGAIGVAGLAAALARMTNLIVAVVAFFVWQIVGILRPVVEGEVWWAWPMAWPVRLVLPVLGVHQNGVPLEPGSPLNTEKPWLALGLCIILGAAGAIAAVLTPDNAGRKPRRGRVVTSSAAASREAGVTTSSAAAGYVPAEVSRAGHARPRPLLALTRVGLTPALITCLAISFVFMAIVGIEYPESYVHGFFTYFVLPIGAGLLPVLVWPQLVGAWSVMRTEYQHSARALLLWSCLCVVAVSLVASVIGFAAGGTWLDEARRFLIAALVGYVIVLLSYLVLLRAGMSVVIAMVLILTIFSITLGGDVLAQTPLWVVAFPSWPESATSPERVVISLVLVTPAIFLLHWRAERLLGRWVER